MDSERILSRLKAELSARAVKRIEANEEPLWVPSAVFVLLFFFDERPHVLLTKRSMTVLHHKGQLSFPGGGWEVGDGSLLNTARRETEEELGIPGEAVEFLGEIDWTTTKTGFSIAPFIGVVREFADFRPSREEVESLLFVPLVGLGRERSPLIPLPPFGDEASPQYLYRGDLIWGATGRIFHQLLQVIRAQV